MGTEPAPLTVSQAVHRAVEVCDLGGADLDDLLVRFEDDDEPISAVGSGIEQRVAEATGALDPEREDPAVVMAGAVIVYLAYRRDAADEEPEELLRLAARAEFEGHPPPHVAQWLKEAGVKL